MPTANPVPSYDPTDLIFNAEKLDEVVNGTSATYTDRRGVQRRTLAGLEAEFPNAQANSATAEEAAVASAASATQAANEAASAATAVDLAFAEATASQASRVAAEAARDAAMLSAGVYATTEAGLAATTSGRYFSVPSADSAEYLILYLNNAGSAVEQKRYPSSAAVTNQRLELSQLNTGALKAIVNSAFPTAYSRGSYLSGSASSPTTTIFGWRSPFKHNGASFNAVQLNFRGNTAGVFRVEIQSSTFQVLAYGQVEVGTSNAVLTVPLNRTVYDIAANQVCYIAYYDPTKTIPAGHPAGGTYDASDADPATNREYYFASAGWGVADPAGNYRIQFRLINANSNPRNFADEVSSLTNSVSNYEKTVGKKNGWPDPFFRSISALTASLFGKNRWRNITGSYFQNYTLVANPYFDGKAIRRAADTGTTSVGGPIVYMDDIGAAAGDTITIYALFVGDGAAVLAPGRFDNGADGGWLDAQVNPVSASGGSGLTVSATPQWLRHQVVVPAGGLRFSFWPYTLTAAKTFDMVAVWAFKGAATAGPAWPIDAADPSLPDRVYAIEQAGMVTQKDGKINNAVMPYVTFNSPLGDGEMDGDGSYAGKTLGYYQQVSSKTQFNTVDLRIWASNSATAVEWKVWIRDSTSAFNMSTTPASASGTVAAGAFPTANSLYRLRLDNPLIASAGQYVFVIFRATDNTSMNMRNWAYNAAITPVRHGFPLYVAGGWDGVFGYSSPGTIYDQPSIKLLLESEEGRSLASAQTAAKTSYNGAASGLAATNVQQAIDQLAASGVAPGVVLPSVIYGVQGRECNVYIDNLHFSDSSEFEHDVTCSYGSQQSERWTWTPSGALASSALTVAVHDKRTGNALVTKSGVIKAAATTAGTGATKKVLVIGDSLINAGAITQTLLDIAATDVMAVTLLGTRGTAPNRHEGRGGWKVSDYATAGRTFYAFTVSGVVTAPAINSTEYSSNGTNVLRVQEVALSGGAGTITCELYSGSAPTGSGTLTKTASSGDAMIAFSAVSPVSGNPFWIGGALNFGQYLTNNSIAVPDFVFIGLGINDVGGAYSTDQSASDASDAAFAQLDGLIASIKAAAPSVKIGLMLPPPPASTQDAFGANYAAGIVRFRLKRNLLIWSRQCIAKYGASEASSIYIVPSNTALDTVNNVSYAAAGPVNSRSSVQVSRQNNGVHPATSGYQQIADAVWAFLKYYA